MQRRLDSLRSHMESKQLDACVFMSIHNVHYYSDFLYCSFGRPYALIVTPTKTVSVSAGKVVRLRAHAQLSYTNIWTYHMEEITVTLLYIYRICSMLDTDPSGWKGSVPYGLGADISLPPCLATGIWNLVPKATSGPKSRGASLGTKLWRHVQRYCAQFLAFMVI